MNNNRREKESISSSATMMKKKKEDVCPRRAGIRTATTPITTQQDASRSGGVVRHEDEPGGGLVQPKNHLTKAAAAAPDIIMRQEQQQQQLLASPPVSKKVVEYVTKTNKDVLLGRGGETNLHPGNQHYLQEVKRFIADYESTPKRSKLNISQQVVDWIARRGGRFIKKEAGTGRWYVVPNEDARNKASQVSSSTMCEVLGVHVECRIVVVVLFLFASSSVV